MLSVIAASVLAVAVPADKLSSVAVAAYWYKKDERGKGDEISEMGKPRRFPAFAIAEDEFLVSDQFVRDRHLDRIEVCFKGERVPAGESARIEGQDVVVLKAERPVPGVVPLRFVDGDPVEKLTWSWNNNMLSVRASNVGTNDGVRVVAETGRVFRSGPGNTLYVDKDRNPVWIDFGMRSEIVGGKFEYVSPAKWKRVPADGFEKSAAAMERRLADASVGILFRLDAEDKENGGRGSSRISFSSYGGAEGKNEIDALGYAIADTVVVPTDLDGEKIARLSKAEATFPDGSKTNLVFAGAIAEWNAIVFDVPEPFKGRVSPLVLADCAAQDFDNRSGWIASVENENGRVVVTVRHAKFDGVDFIRGALFVPNASGAGPRDDWRDRRSQSLVLDSDGRLATMRFARRFRSERWASRETEPVATSDIARFVAGELYNPEFAPRKEDERGRFVWLGVETVRLTDALARERKAQSFMKDYSRPPYVTEIYPDSPAASAGLQVGDVLLAVRRGNEAERELESESDYMFRDWGSYFDSDSSYVPSSMPWPDVESPLNKLLTSYGAGAKVTVVYARDGVRREVQVVLASAPVHYQNAAKARNRALGLSVRDMTFEVRRYFKFDEKASGIVIARVKPGSPAAVAGLKPFELVTEVNGEKVAGAKDFAAKIKGKSDLVFAVRRLAQTRMVKLHVEPEQGKNP